MINKYYFKITHPRYNTILVLKRIVDKLNLKIEYNENSVIVYSSSNKKIQFIKKTINNYINMESVIIDSDLDEMICQLYRIVEICDLSNEQIYNAFSVLINDFKKFNINDIIMKYRNLEKNTYNEIKKKQVRMNTEISEVLQKLKKTQDIKFSYILYFNNLITMFGIYDFRKVFI